MKARIANSRRIQRGASGMSRRVGSTEEVFATGKVCQLDTRLAATRRGARRSANRLSVTRRILLQQPKLLGEVVLGDVHRRLEVVRQMFQASLLATAVRKLHPPHEIEQQRSRQQRITPLPDELQRHRSAKKTLEMDVVPRRLAVAHGGDVLDRNQSLRFI